MYPLWRLAAVEFVTREEPGNFITNLDFNPFCCNLFGRYPRGHVLQWVAGLCEFGKEVCAREKQCGAKEGFVQRLRKRDDRRGRMRES
jgi:hypothetical protein